VPVMVPTRMVSLSGKRDAFFVDTQYIAP